MMRGRGVASDAVFKILVNFIGNDLLAFSSEMGRARSTSTNSFVQSVTGRKQRNLMQEMLAEGNREKLSPS
jgi:hypothetical protein